jgi:hypothetical protein
MKFASTLLFLTAAPVGAMAFSKAEGEAPLPVPALLDGFKKPVLEIPKTAFGEAVEDALKAYINPELYECEPTVVQTYIWSLLYDIKDVGSFYRIIDEYALDDLLSYAAVYGPRVEEYVFGGSQPQTDEFKNHFSAMKSFWAAESDTEDVLLKSFSGQMLNNTDLMVYTYVEIFGLEEEYASAIVRYVQWSIENDPRLAGLGYDSPLWSLNAFAVHFLEQWDYPDQIIYGDGMLDFAEYIDVEDAGPDFFLSHEFAHLLQYNLGGVISAERTAESTRHSELMADALSAYYLAHEDGAFLRDGAIEELTVAAFSTGDCDFDRSSHHGTPNQRKGAAAYGAALATEDQSTILSPKGFVDRFDADYVILIAPDSYESAVCDTFAVHARTAVTFDGVMSNVHSGDVSVYPGTSVTGSYTFVDGAGRLVSDSSDFAASVLVAYTDAMAVHADGNDMAVEIGGVTFTPGTYRSGSAINFAHGTVVTLDGLNEADPVFLFQAVSTLVTAADTTFILVNGTRAENVLWATGTAATIGARSVVPGSIMAGTAITFGTESELHGCALAQTAVTFESGGSIGPLFEWNY